MPHASARAVLVYATISRALDEYLQATHWSDDPALDIEEAHARAAEIRERNAALCGCVEE